MEDERKGKIYVVGKFYIPARMMSAIRRYIDHKYPVGDFLTAVLGNDLRTAVDRADSENLANLPAFVHYLYNEAPPQCWGSAENVKGWLEAGAAEREAKTNER